MLTKGDEIRIFHDPVKCQKIEGQARVVATGTPYSTGLFDAAGEVTLLVVDVKFMAPAEDGDPVRRKVRVNYAGDQLITPVIATAIAPRVGARAKTGGR